MRAIPVYERLRKIRTEEEETAVQLELYFQLPRKTGLQISPRVAVIKSMKRSEQNISLRILRKIMKRSRVPKLNNVINVLLDMDKSESIVPHGEVSKRIYNEIFHTREFNLYGRNITTKEHISYDERRERELANKAVELGVEFVSLHKFERNIENNKKINRYGIPDIFNKNIEDLKKPSLTTPIWSIGYEEMKTAPIGTKKDPGLIYKSEGNEIYFSYNGEWNKGKICGNGKYLYLDGFTYIGKFDNNWQNGFGTAEYSNGGKYIGEWNNGRYCTEKIIKPKEIDSTLTESFKKGSELYTCTGSHYIGEFDYGRRDGEGTLTLPCGLTYVGKFTDGKPHGRGIMTSKLSGYSYDGNWIK